MIARSHNVWQLKSVHVKKATKLVILLLLQMVIQFKRETYPEVRSYFLTIYV